MSLDEKKVNYAAAALTGILSNAKTMSELTAAYEKNDQESSFIDNIAVLAHAYAIAMVDSRNQSKAREILNDLKKK
jgi:hypothetical protein